MIEVVVDGTGELLSIIPILFTEENIHRIARIYAERFGAIQSISCDFTKREATVTFQTIKIGMKEVAP